jgi:hypothetical protein
LPSPKSSKSKGASNQNASPKSTAGKNSEKKSNDVANEYSEGGEDIFPGCRKERLGDCAAKGTESGLMAVDASTKYVPRQHKNRFTCTQVNLPARK